jgi:hypothetical protein
MPRLPSDAFERFLALGPARSYSQLARALGVSKRSVVACASREGWQAKLARIDDAARRRNEDRAVEDVAAIDERHLRTCRAVQARGLEALKAMAITNPGTAVRAITAAIALERAILGRGKEEAQGITWREILGGIAARRNALAAAPATATPAPPPPPAPEPAAPREVRSWPYGQN